MSVPPSSLRAFLSTAKSSLRNAVQSHKHINFVIGNESADLDSITCSIVYAYFRSSSPQKSAQSTLYVPLLNIPHDDIQIRPELLHLLPHANIEPSHLITLSDLPRRDSSLSDTLAPESTTWILVDHNALQGVLGKIYSSQVNACIDHHVDEKKVPNNADPRVITKSGSCTSLVVNQCRSVWDALSASASISVIGQAQDDAAAGSDDAVVRKTWDAQIAKLALASILIDTSDLQDGGKVTDHDIKAVAYLEAKIMGAPGSAKWSRRVFFEGLSKAKKDLRNLKVRDVLRKDYKEWDEGGGKLVGISSCVTTLEWLSDKATSEEESEKGQDGQVFLQSIQSFIRERNLSVYAIMTTSTSSSGHFQRELLLWVPDQESCSDVVRKFQESSSGELKLEDWKEGNMIGVLGQEGIRVWWQRSVEKSRKQVGPLLRAAMQ